MHIGDEHIVGLRLHLEQMASGEHLAESGGYGVGGDNPCQVYSYKGSGEIPCSTDLDLLASAIISVLEKHGGANISDEFEMTLGDLVEDGFIFTGSEFIILVHGGHYIGDENWEIIIATHPDSVLPCNFAGMSEMEIGIAIQAAVADNIHLFTPDISAPEPGM